MTQTDYGTDEPFWVDNAWLDTIVVVGLICFILCLMKLSKVTTSKMGMIYGIIGMAALIVGYGVDETYTYDDGRWLIGISMIPGILLGLWSAMSVDITGLPELVGAYNGFGGLAAGLEGIGQYLYPDAKYLVRGGEVIAEQTSSMLWIQSISLVLSIVIGMMTFTGSTIACLKLHGTISSKSRVIPHRPLVTMLIFVAITVFGVFSFTGGQDWNDRGLGVVFIIIIAILSLAYGIIAVMAIGGGDMPVSISFLNALSGLSTSMAGFMLSNKALIVSGAFVGASGMILTLIMCKNMNRSISNVLVGGFGAGSNKTKKTKGNAVGVTKEVSAEDVVQMLTTSKNIIIVPGFGMAVAKAQYAVAELTSNLRARGINIRFAIHPVAGRLPGHMNVLLAESKIPYDITFAMDDINADFPDTDLAIVLGANDIVNPSAQTDPDSPIAGMPVLEVWKAKQTICMKRSLNVGYAGVDNPLFIKENNSMYLGDAKNSLEKLLHLLSDSTPTPNEAGVKADIESIKKETEEVKEDPFFAQIPDLQSKAFLKVGICKEIGDKNEKRVAMIPDIAKKLLKTCIQVVVQSNSGKDSGFSNGSYAKVGCLVMDTSQEVYNSADVIIKIRQPTVQEIEMLGEGKTMICPIIPQSDEGMKLLQRAKETGVNILAIDCIPRISRAQKLDVLTSQARLAGYRAVVEAANVYQRCLNGEMTAAGSFAASKVLVIGAGVAGLAAISTATSMGSVVRAFDTRLATRDEVESLGGEFLVLDFDNEEGDEGTGYAKVMSDSFIQAEMKLFREQAKECNIIITTAAIPGRSAPLLIMKDAVDNMQSGSVIVDLAASTGGNCECTKPGETYMYDNLVTIVGATDLSSKMAWQSSSMYANNMLSLLQLLCQKQKFEINMKDPVIRGMTCVYDNDITWPPPASVVQTRAIKSKNDTLLVVQKGSSKTSDLFAQRVLDIVSVGELCIAVFCTSFLVVLGFFAPVTFVNQFLFFLLACFLGFYLVRAIYF